MKLLLIQPSVGKIHGEKYVKSWTMEPLALSTLAGMTPDDIDIELIDERIDELPEIYEMYPGINGNTHGDKKLIKPAPSAINSSVIIFL